MSEPKKTPLYDVHQSLGGKMVEFAGFLMPVAYGSIIDEHNAVRERVGVFDVSHMGQFVVTGTDAREFVNRMITNDCSKLLPGNLQYTVMCREDGTVVDDLLVYVISEDRIILVVNAANIEKDYEHLTSRKRKNVEVSDVSEEYALVAVQGPRTREVIAACPFFGQVADRLQKLPYYNGITFYHRGAEVLVSRTGYTGELGFEVFVPAELAVALWDQIVVAGEDCGLAVIGLGARDTLRFEAAYCLYGHELDDHTSPLEAGLSWVVKLKKPSFCGAEALRKEKAKGSKRVLIGLAVSGRNIARQGYTVLRDGREVGRVTSGAFAPTLHKSLCMALVDRACSAGDGQFAVWVRDKEVPAKPTSLPFYKSRAK
ncbi:MAG: glycine cleavage system aminomethyltransferase GcvT [Candidatus Krumholzibacteria bacterium]|nr:glycine cleavage system aminomethyltransferase GcvT [Candidatus Krumholzibacteria bacterium]